MEVLTAVDRDLIETLRGRDEFFWLDLKDPSDEDLQSSGELLGLHELALEDTREFNQRPKLDRYPEHVLLVYWSARVTEDGLGTEPVEVHLHISGSFLVTVRREPSIELDKLHQALAPEGVEVEEYVLYRVLDGLTDALFPVVEHLEGRIDALEAAVLRTPDRGQLGAIYRLKQEVQLLDRLLISQRDQFGATTSAIIALPGLTHGAREYLRDVGDHLAQVTGETYRQSEDLNAMTTTYFNANANRLNALATRLTVLATFFLIWTLVTSFFGQNFRWLTEHVDSLRGFLIFGVGGLLVPTAIAFAYFWSRRDEWL